MHPALLGTPVLRTERLALRAPVAGDWPTFRDFAMSDRTAYVGGIKTEDEAAQKFAAFIGHWILRGFGRLWPKARDLPLKPPAPSPTGPSERLG